VVALIAYSIYFFLVVTGKGVHPQTIRESQRDSFSFHKIEPVEFSLALQPMVSMIAGFAAMVGIGTPFVRDFFKLRMRRIYALAKLGFIEAYKSRVLYVFLVVLLPFLFPVNWFLPVKPEDELRTSVRVTSIAMELLLLFAAGLLTAFSIPSDIKNQNIYTIVSKPVERFEIVLGRFLGYTGLMTIALLVMTSGSLFLMSSRKLDEKAEAETQKARVPHRGSLGFFSRKGQLEGTNVGREFDYRKYIPGATATTERAIWSFKETPSTLTVGDKDAISCEFSFDIFRLTKGEENRGVDINVRITSHNCKQVPPTDRSTHKWQWTDKAKETAYLAEKNAIETRLKNGEFGPGAPRSLDSSRPGDAGWKFVNELAQKYGFYEFVSKEVYDYHPDGFPVPVGLFVNSREGVPEVVNGTNYPRVQVFVQCTSPGQMLGMAEGDLYFLEGTQPFWVNYFKSSFGMWCRMTLVIALAVSLSTYLAGVVSLLATALVYLSAYLSEHIRDVASRTNTGGGPFESL
ncbi:MAG: hypothetical protein ACRCZF_07630, partial [Gemmataceae bacterium]